MPAEYVWRRRSSRPGARRRPQADLEAEPDVLIIEKQPRQKTPRSRRIAVRLAQRCGEPRRIHGTAIVVVDQPAAVVPAVKKCWLAITRQLEAELAGTLARTRIAALDKQIERMQATEFVVGMPEAGSSESRVFFVGPEDVGRSIRLDRD